MCIESSNIFSAHYGSIFYGRGNIEVLRRNLQMQADFGLDQQLASSACHISVLCPGNLPRPTHFQRTSSMRFLVVIVDPPHPIPTGGHVLGGGNVITFALIQRPCLSGGTDPKAEAPTLWEGEGVAVVVAPAHL